MNAAAGHLLANFEATPTQSEIRAQRGTIFRPAGPPRAQRLTLMPAPPPLTNVAAHNSSTSSISFISLRLPALKLSCLSFSCPHPLFSIVCGLFYENTGGGIPLPALHGVAPDESQVTSHQSGLAKSFGIRSYADRPILHYFGANKSFRIRSYRTSPRNPFRIRSYENPRGVMASPLSSVAAWRIRQLQTPPRLLGSPLWCEN
jgi:hypothetical protein